MSKQVAEMVALALASPGCLLETEGTVAPPPLWQASIIIINMCLCVYYIMSLQGCVERDPEAL
jgi:hypothetical protein